MDALISRGEGGRSGESKEEKGREGMRDIPKGTANSLYGCSHPNGT